MMHVNVHYLILNDNRPYFTVFSFFFHPRHILYIRWNHSWGLFIIIFYLFAALPVHVQEEIHEEFLLLLWNSCRVNRWVYSQLYATASPPYIRTDDEVHLEKKKMWFSVCYLRWMFSVLPASPPTPQIPSMMNHSALTHQSVWWNACACV